MSRIAQGLSLLTGAALCAGILAAPVPASAGPPAAPGASKAAALPTVTPVPDSMTARGGKAALGKRVAVVRGPTTDRAATAALRTLLSDRDVRAVDVVDPSAPVRPGQTAIYLGGADENPVTASVLRSLHVKDAADLPAEGYVLATASLHGRTVIALDGHDPTGTFYAVQTLRQLLSGTGKRVSVPGVVVRDRPDEALRGTIEGFYGTPWSDAQRLVQMDFYGRHKMNTYVYSPKDDPYLRAKWRDPYPADELAVLKKLVSRATANHVEFTYALSPGLSVCYTSAADEQALVAKFQSLWDIGVRSFSIPLDDISYTKWNCDADAAKFGTGGGAAGTAQSYLLNQVQQDFIATHDGAARLQMVPTEYSDVKSSAYKTAIKADLDPAVIVGWTGVGVIAATITGAQAAQAKSVFGHDILLWDNYPVNDYVTDRLLLGPYVGRSADMTDHLIGVTANPMIQPEASKIALVGVASYTWNSGDYVADAEQQNALTELSGGDRRAREALAAFADLEHSSRLDTVQAPALAKRIAAFWAAWEQGDRRAANRLDDYLYVVEHAEGTLRDRMHDAEFVREAKPWLDATTAWGRSARAALQMIVDARSGDVPAALRERATVVAQRTTARSFTYDGLGGSVHVTVGDGVVDRFVADALAAFDRSLGLPERHVTATTSLPTYQNYEPANMTDSDETTYFWSSRVPAAGDYVGVDLGKAESVSTVSIAGGDSASPNDYLHAAALEYSADGTTWTTVDTYTDQATIAANLPAGTSARYVRLRATAAGAYWVKIHEFTVTGPDSARPQVSGTPAPATGSSLAAAADGTLDTSYLAGAEPAAGDALLVTLPTPRTVRRVGVVGTGRATVEVHVGGTWHSLGTLATTGYTDLPAGGRTISAIRLSWRPGSHAPSIAEVIPRYA